MPDNETLSEQEFEEFLDYIMFCSDVDEWSPDQIATTLLNAGVVTSHADARRGGLRAIKYLLTNGYLQAFSEPGPVENRKLLAESPKVAYEIIENNWEKEKLYPGALMVWLYSTEKGMKWCNELAAKDWTTPEKYN